MGKNHCLFRQAFGLIFFRVFVVMTLIVDYSPLISMLLSTDLI